MIADAVHSLSDFATDLVVVVTLFMTQKPKDANHDYGHGKFETLATLIIGVSLLFVGIGIGWNGLQRVIDAVNGEILPAPHYIALYAAVLSISAKELLYRYTVKTGKAINSQAVIANAWHHRSDALSLIGICFGIGGVFFLWQNLTILDPIAGMVVSIFILKVSIQLSLESINQLLECSLPKKEKEKLLDLITSFEEVQEPHNLKTRKIGNNIAVDIHIRVNPSLTVAESHSIATKIEQKIKTHYGNESFVSVHIEPIKS